MFSIASRLSGVIFELRQARLRSRIRFRPAHVQWLLIIATLFVIGVHLASLELYPPVFIDEPWYSDVAWTFLQTGIPFDSMFSGALDQWNAYWVRWQLLAVLPFSASFGLFGLGLFQARLVSWFFGSVLLWAIFAVGSRLYSKLTGALAMLLLSLSPVYLQASHYARPDIFLAATITVALYLLIVGLDENRPVLLFLSSLLAGLSVDIHTNGAMFALALAVLFIVENRKNLRSRHTAAFVAGAVISIVYYATVHFLPDLDTYLLLSSAWQGGTHLPPIAALDARELLESFFGEMGRYHFYDNSLDFALIGAGALYCMVRHNQSDRRLLIYGGIPLLLFVLLVANKHDIYAIVFYPFFLLIAAESLISMLREAGKRRGNRVFVVALLVLFLVNSGLHFIRPISRNQSYEYGAITEQIERVVPPESRVLGLPNWWLGLAEYDYRSIMSLTYYHMFNGHSLTRGLEEIQPDYIIVDNGLRGLLVDEGYFPPGPGFAIYNLPKIEFEEFLAKRGESVLSFSNPWHGRFEIYAIDWD